MDKTDFSLHPDDAREFRLQTELAIEALTDAGLPKEFIALLFRQALAGHTFEYLAQIHKMSFVEPHKAWDLAEETWHGPARGIEGLHYGFAAFQVSMALNMRGGNRSGGKRERKEAQIEEKFYKNLSVYLSGAVKVDGPKGVTALKPDGFIELGGKLLPVEVKAERFGRSALGQLQEYMTLFKCLKGVAVAPKLGVTLPKNVIFVSVEPDEDNVIKFPIH